TQSQAHANTRRDWGFRHAWNLNLSVPKALVEEVGGFNCGIANCCYEDVELAYRIATEFDAPVIFNPAAIAVHDHQMSPNDYLAREYRLGYAVFGFARLAPEGAVAVFGHDPASPDALAYAKQYVAVEGRREQTLRTQFASIAAWSADTHLTTGSPPDAISEFVTERDPADGHPDSQLIRLAYEFHLPLKRLMFRRGLLDAAEGRRVAGLYHADDTQRPATTLHQ
ncbi:MAG: glycosyltransferase family 2 protein, partial [Planctomycetota bacterium]